MKHTVGTNRRGSRLRCMTELEGTNPSRLDGNYSWGTGVKQLRAARQDFIIARWNPPVGPPALDLGAAHGLFYPIKCMVLPPSPQKGQRPDAATRFSGNLTQWRPDQCRGDPLQISGAESTSRNDMKQDERTTNNNMQESAGKTEGLWMEGRLMKWQCQP